jgi:predicted DNA-binding transcriptional regulator YafY
MALRQVEAEAAAGYGIFRGGQVQWATLVFSAEAARWVRAESWHPDQQGRDLPDGRYELKVPYADPRELEMDVLRHAENVEVIAPAALRAQVARRLAAARARYE